MTVPAAVADAYGLGAHRFEIIASGLINATFLARAPDGAPARIVQRLHPIFAGEVNLDIEAVTEHLAARGLDTPRLVRSEGGDAWVEHDGIVWRALSYVEGTSFDRVESPAMARSAGELVGRFHRAVADLEHDFAFARAGVHDTAAHLAKLAAAEAGDDTALLRDAEALRARILDTAASLPAMPPLPRRICHGDLKLSNLRFDLAGRHARCLIDLDTLGEQTLAYELGDALRSWCNPLGEDVAAPTANLEILGAALDGYAAGADGAISRDEIDAISIGLETVCVELSARFCVDVFDDRYFGWDASRFSSRREHNLARARGQLALAGSVAAQRAEVAARVRTAFSGF